MLNFSMIHKVLQVNLLPYSWIIVFNESCHIQSVYYMASWKMLLFWQQMTFKLKIILTGENTFFGNGFLNVS